MKGTQAPGNNPKAPLNARKTNWRVIRKGFCSSRSRHYSRPMPHLLTGKVSVAIKDSDVVETFTICNWCGGRKK